MPLQLAEIAIHIPSIIPLLEKYELNYYQNGKQTLKEACDEKGLDYKLINLEFDMLQKQQQPNITIEDMHISVLIDHINGQHHDHEAEALSHIEKGINNLITHNFTPKKDLDVLNFVAKKFNILKKQLSEHCVKEDKLLFPLLRKITRLKEEKSPLFKHSFKRIKDIVQSLEEEHLESTKSLSEIKTTLNSLTVNDTSLKEYHLLINCFKEFEADFHIHIHIENNVLFPKILEL